MVLLSILKKLRRKEKEMRLLLVGLDNAGKSTILSKINGEEIDSVAPTLGFNIKTFNYADYVLNVWDVGRCPLFDSRLDQNFDDLSRKYQTT